MTDTPSPGTSEAPSISPGTVVAMLVPGAEGYTSSLIAVGAPDITTGPTLQDKENRLHDIVQGWLSSNIHGSPVSRSTEAYNHLVAALPALRALIMKDL